MKDYYELELIYRLFLEKFDREQRAEKNAEAGDLSSDTVLTVENSKFMDIDNLRNQTYSNFNAEEISVLHKASERIRCNAKFSSFDEFETFFEAYKIVNFAPYRIARYDYREGSNNVGQVVAYFSIIYRCTFGSKEHNKRRGKIWWCSPRCKAMLRVLITSERHIFKIKTFKREHSHHLSEKNYQASMGIETRIGGFLVH
ncbi:unnamed protein product [Thelazia callipaeda]|uniref:Protein FAR1-RELATED SEQUENCE n=1 Tax=Thelazia callipaeda TaxID=103827 RepID=A0A0N5CZ01_THECL|nr:unnamed protein product [Thelazia callipaeda]